MTDGAGGGAENAPDLRLRNVRVRSALVQSVHIPNVHRGALVDVLLSQGRIADLRPAGAPPPDAEGIIESLDLDGRYVGPGLWDEHVHLTQWARQRARLDVSRATSAAHAARLVADALAARGRSAGSLVGVGYRDALWSDAPHRDLLDAVAPDHPVVLIATDLHACWLNRTALTRFGRPDHPTGVLREEECFAIVEGLDEVPEAESDAWVADGGRAAAARGVVGVVDLEMTWNVDAWSRRRAAGFDALRIEFGVYPQHLAGAIADGMRGGDRLDDLVTVGPAKVITDGSLNTRTAYCVDPYPGELTHPHGLLTVRPDELRDLLHLARAGGFTPAVHAIGDEANRLALDAFEDVGIGGRIEHAQLLRVEDLARFAPLGVIASVQPEHAMDDRDVAEQYWAGRTDRAFPLASLAAAGARILLGSDAPVAPLDPWVTIAAAVGRARDGRPAWHPEQRVDVRAALAASVRTAVAVGEPADLVVTDADPFSADGTALRGMPVAATFLAGRATHLTL